MSKGAEIAKHLLRTFLLVIGITAVMIGVFFIIPFPWSLGAIIVIIVLTVMLTGRLHARWAPVSDRVDSLKWKEGGAEGGEAESEGGETGRSFETVVELAHIHAATYAGVSAVKSRVLRVSIYLMPQRKLRKRRLIGDSARYLGRQGDGMWFFIKDRYHARKDGLVCMDPRTAEFLFHLPLSKVELEEGKKGQVKVMVTGEDRKAVEFDLKKTVESKLNGPGATRDD